jgi:outer membrane protein assembly factor BamD (BamD/ComL family)
MRYQHLYPDGKLSPQSMLIMGKSWYKGGNKEKAIDVLTECHMRFTNNKEGETALFYTGLIRLESEAYYFAAKNFQEYNYVYNNGIFQEDVLINLSLVYALAENYNEAENRILEYKKIFPDGRLKKKADDLYVLMTEAKTKQKKSLFAAGLSSAIIPGSGYFYTENYMLGIFSLLTNGALIYGIYDGYKKKDQFQMIFFSVIEFSFYNYSIVGSIKSADEYNKDSEFKKEVLMGFKTSF